MNIKVIILLIYFPIQTFNLIFYILATNIPPLFEIIGSNLRVPFKSPELWEIFDFNSINLAFVLDYKNYWIMSSFYFLENEQVL